MEALTALDSGLTTRPILPHGLLQNWYHQAKGRPWWLETPSISVLMEVRALSHGRMTPQTNPRTFWKTSISASTAFAAASAPVIQDFPLISLLLVTSSISMQQMVPASVYGVIDLQSSIIRQIRVGMLLHGQSMPAYQAVSPLVRITAQSTVHQQNCGHKPPTWSGQTTAAVLQSVISTSL